MFEYVKKGFISFLITGCH